MKPSVIKAIPEEENIKKEPITIHIYPLHSISQKIVEGHNSEIKHLELI